MKIIIERRQVYGKTLYYPVCQNAEIFASLTKTRTLDQFQLKKIKSLGYTIELKQIGLSETIKNWRNYER